MEVRCPSCGAQHRSEDYPGAFDILCGCGYLILNPELDSGSRSDDAPNFEGPPAVSVSSVIPVAAESENNAVDFSPPSNDEGANESFSIENLTLPENLPEGMLYDPTEVPQNTSTFSQILKPEASQVFVERVQKASMGQILGADYDLEITHLQQEAKLKARERVERFLQDHKWLREIMERRSFIMDDLFQTERLLQVPEPLAVEIYTACLENGGKCSFTRSQLT